MGLARLLNDRRVSRRSGLLRNSTIFRCAKNWDSNSARRKPPERRETLSRDLIVQQPRQPHRTSINASSTQSDYI